MWRSVDDDLFPHGTAETVLEVMDFIEDHDVQLGECPGIGVDHVAQYLGRHDDDRGVTVDRVVSRQEADGSGTVRGTEVAVFLVGESL